MQFKLAAVSALLATAANGLYLPAAQQDASSITQQPLIQAPSQEIAATQPYQLNEGAAAAYWAEKNSLPMEETAPASPLGETATTGGDLTGHEDTAIGMDVTGGNASPYGSQASSTVAPTTAAPISTTAATTLASPAAPTLQSGYAIPQEQNQSDLHDETVAPVAPTTAATSTVPASQSGGDAYESASSTEAYTASTVASVAASTPQAGYATSQKQSETGIDVSAGDLSVIAPIAPTSAPITSTTASILQAEQDSYGAQPVVSTPANVVASAPTSAPEIIPQKPVLPRSGVEASYASQATTTAPKSATSEAAMDATATTPTIAAFSGDAAGRMDTKTFNKDPALMKEAAKMYEEHFTRHVLEGMRILEALRAAGQLSSTEAPISSESAVNNDVASSHSAPTEASVLPQNEKQEIATPAAPQQYGASSQFSTTAAAPISATPASIDKEAAGSSLAASSRGSQVPGRRGHAHHRKMPAAGLNNY